jgi:DNA-binding CsgD family transcriptional regulator
MQLKEMPIEIIKEFNPALNSEKELIETMYKKHTLEEMARIMGYSVRYFTNRMKKYGIKIKTADDTPGRPGYIFLKLGAAQIKKMTQKEIAVKCNCTPQWAGCLLRKYSWGYRSNRLKKGERYARVRDNY